MKDERGMQGTRPLVKIMPNNGLARPREALLLWEILDPSLILAML